MSTMLEYKGYLGCKRLVNPPYLTASLSATVPA
jgi:hypothetical protein